MIPINSNTNYFIIPNFIYKGGSFNQRCLCVASIRIDEEKAIRVGSNYVLILIQKKFYQKFQYNLNCFLTTKHC